MKKREYNFYKKLCKELLKQGTPNPAVYDCKPIAPPQILLGILSSYLKEENWEACAAIKDCIKEWFEERGHPIPPEATLNIPEYKKPEGYRISYGVHGDPTGIGSSVFPPGHPTNPF